MDASNMWMATDVGEWFHPNLGFIRSDDDETWHAVPLKIYGGKRLEEEFDCKESAAVGLAYFVSKQPRPTIKKDQNPFEIYDRSSS